MSESTLLAMQSSQREFNGIEPVYVLIVIRWKDKDCLPLISESQWKCLHYDVSSDLTHLFYPCESYSVG